MSDELADLRRQVDRLPAEVTAKLRAVAWRTSRAVKDQARANLLRQIKGHGDPNHQRTADSFVITEEPDKKQFLVGVENPSNPNLALWLERGTINMAARPFLRPAADALSEGYKREMAKAAEETAMQVLGATR